VGGVGVCFVMLIGIFSRASKILLGVVVSSTFRWFLLVRST
jgi:hypothetical protein